MKTIHFENLSETLRSIMNDAEAELERVEYAQDDAAEAVAVADAAEDWNACDEAEAEYKRLKHNAEDLRMLLNALHDAANAFEGLEDEGRDVLRNMGLM